MPPPRTLQPAGRQETLIHENHEVMHSGSVPTKPQRRNVAAEQAKCKHPQLSSPFPNLGLLTLLPRTVSFNMLIHKTPVKRTHQYPRR